MGSLAVWCFTHPWWTLAVALVVIVIGTVGLMRLHVDADVSRLLPESIQSVKDVNRLRERFGGVGYVALVVDGGTSEARRAHAARLSKKLETLPTVKWVEARQETEFFASRALYYLDLDDLAEVRDRISARKRWEVNRKNPFYFDLEDRSAPPLLFDDIEAKYSERLGPNRGRGGDGYYEDQELGRLIVLVKPAKLASDLAFTREVVSQVQGAVDELSGEAGALGLNVQLSGRYKKKLELQRVVEDDMKTATLAALLLVLGYLTFHFRRFSALVLLMTPLGIGLLLTYAGAGMLIGTLNILTAFIGAVLVGMGLDVGIHLLDRFQVELEGSAFSKPTEVSAGSTVPEAALLAAFSDTGRAGLLATITTVVAFGALFFSELRAFREVGIVAGGGMLLGFLSFSTVLPSMLGLAHRWGHLPTKRFRSSAYRPLGSRRSVVTVLLGILSVGTLTYQARSVRFEHDFEALAPQELPSFVLDRSVNKILRRSQTPLFVETESASVARIVGQELAKRRDEHKRTTGIGQVVGSGELIPKDQPKKKALLDQIALDTRSLAKGAENQERKAELLRLIRLASSAPFSMADLPPQIRRQIAPNGQNRGEYVLVFPTISLGDGKKVMRLADELRDIRIPGRPNLRAAGEAMVLADVLKEMNREIPQIVLVGGAGVLIVLWLLFGSWRSALLAAVPAFAGLAGTFGLMSLLDLPLNFMNVIALPVLVGVGVDGGVHLIARHRTEPDLARVVGETGRGIFGSLLTSTFGFGAMMLADHPGLRSLGQVSIIGLTLLLILTLLLLPAMLALPRWPGSRPRGAGASAPR